MGIKVAIDDFGTGYSSLAYLKSLPIDEIKIDRSIITDMGGGEDVIVRSMVDLGRNLGLEVTAEGVEDQDTYTALLKLGCTRAQGYHLGRPVAAEEIVERVIPTASVGV